MTWVDDITSGVRSVLNPEYRRIYLRIDHMDTKHVSDAAYLEQIYQLYLLKYKAEHFDVVITADDAALNFVLRHGDILFPNVPVVFCGVGQRSDEWLKVRPGISGVLEATDPRRTLNLALTLHPGVRRIFIVSDRSVVGLMNRARISPLLRSLIRDVEVTFLDDLPIAELESRLRAIPSDSIVYLDYLSRDRSGRYLTPLEAVRRVAAASRAPVYSSSFFDVSNGAIGGYTTWGRLHGEAVARLALRVLDGVPPASIPVVEESPAESVFEYSQLKRFGLALSSLPSDSTILNKPYSFYERYRLWVWTAAAFILIETAIVIVLIINWLRRRRAEEALRRSMSTEQALFDAVPDLILRLDRNATFTSYHAPGDLRCFPAIESLLGKTPDQVFPAEAAARYRSTVDRVLSRRQAERYEYSLEVDGSTRTFEGRMVPCGEAEVVAIVCDITETERLREQLFQVQKMEAIGQLAGSVAHDFNNLLTAILGYASLLKATPNLDKRIEGMVTVIEEAAERASDLTRRLLGFARRGKFLSVPVDMTKVIGELIRLLERTLDRSIVIRQRLRVDRALVHGDPGQLQQALLNLAVNSRDAMPEGGVLTIELSTVELADEDARRPPGIEAGPYALISVNDTGCGIPADLQQRIFEPFFTTKEQGKGVGMGLAMVYGICRSHGGFTEVVSEAGKGATFLVYLPLFSDAPPARPAAIQAPVAHGVGRVLLVDDEPFVIAVASDLLRTLGYVVFAADGGRRAVEMYREFGTRLEVVLLDMVMPGMNGWDCYRELKKLDSRVQVILASGYGPDGKIQEIVDESGCSFLQKPYNIHELSSAVAGAVKLRRAAGASSRLS
jgi:signal transduction histidine kinase/ActR/RegA family two-component response regulator